MPTTSSSSFPGCRGGVQVFLQADDGYTFVQVVDDFKKSFVRDRREKLSMTRVSPFGLQPTFSSSGRADEVPVIFSLKFVAPLRVQLSICLSGSVPMC